MADILQMLPASRPEDARFTLPQMLDYTSPVELHSPRLRLRRLCAADADAICAYRSLPEVARFQSWEAFGPADAVRLIASQQQIAENTPDAWIQLALTLRDSGQIVGDCGIHFLVDGQQLELGITLSPTYQRQGFAAEALASVLDHAFGSLNKHRVTATVDAANPSAARLFERLGFRQEAHLVENIWFKGAWGSERSFAILRREWQTSSRVQTKHPKP